MLEKTRLYFIVAQLEKIFPNSDVLVLKLLMVAENKHMLIEILNTPQKERQNYKNRMIYVAQLAFLYTREMLKYTTF